MTVVTVVTKKILSLPPPLKLWLNLKLNMWQNFKKNIFNCDKTQKHIVTKLENSICDKTQIETELKFPLLHNWNFTIVTKVINSNCYKTHKLKLWPNSKTLIVTQVWQYSKTHCDKTKKNQCGTKLKYKLYRNLKTRQNSKNQIVTTEIVTKL